MIRHNDIGVKNVLPKHFLSGEKRVDDEFRNPRVLQPERASSRPIQCPVHADEAFPGARCIRAKVAHGRDGSV
jgi:hypothetical protein